MEHNKKMSFSSRQKSFSYAFNGLWQLFKQEPNAKLHALATAAVIIAGFVKNISHAEWLAIVFAIGLIWITEAINTCIEKLCDFSCENKFHPAIKIIKDIAAGAVLIAGLVSLATGIIVFIL